MQRKLSIFLIAFFCPGFIFADAPPMLRFPDIFKDQVAFSMRGNLWRGDIKTGKCQQLTDWKGREYFAKFSPDGKWIAFTGERNGSPQVYVMASSGGTARQLTFYPSQVNYYPSKVGFDHQVLDWSPDGAFILYRSSQGGPGPIARFFKVPFSGGWPEPLPLSEAGYLSYSPDGIKIAFNRSVSDFNLQEAWKNYRGGMADNLWMYDLSLDQVKRITQWEGVDQFPMWIRNRIYFASDRSGSQNLYSLDVASHQIVQLTRFTNFDLKWPSADSESIVFEYAGQLHRFDVRSQKSTPIQLSISYSPPARNVGFGEFFESVSVSNDRKIAIGSRGEIVVVKGNESSNLTKTPSAREKNVSFQPEGEWVAFISDVTGREEVFIRNEAGEVRQITRESKSLLRWPAWSPDGLRIAYHDYAGNLFVVDAVTGEKYLVDHAPMRRISDYAFSPDGKWLVYSKADSVDFSSLWLFSLEDRSVTRLTEGRYRDSNPVFSPDGNFLWFVSRRSYEAILSRLEYDISFGNMDRIYQATLRPSPATPADWLQRIRNSVPLSIEPGVISRLKAMQSMVVYERTSDYNGDWKLCAFDIAQQKEITVSRDRVRSATTPDGSSLILLKGDTYSILSGREMEQPAVQWVDVKQRLEIDLRKEWHELVGEAWRWQQELNYFQKAIDWQGLLSRYQPLVDSATDRDDVNYILAELIGNVGVSHTWARGGDIEQGAESTTGLLGAEFAPDSNGYFRISKILGSAERPAGASPLSEASVGEYILQIDGKPLKLPATPYELLAGKGSQKIPIVIGKTTGIGDSRVIEVAPVSSEVPLYYDDWVEQNRRKVEEQSSGRFGYLHIPNFEESGLSMFAASYFYQLNREGLIIDTRFADGGYLAEAVAERLRRIVVGMNLCVSCGKWTYPRSAFQGKIVVLVNQYSSSDGDLFPYLVSQYRLGPVIGTRTWGGVIGGHALELADGGEVGVADNATTNRELIPALENRGFVPDIIVENQPNDVSKGRDDQLQAALDWLRDALKNR